MARGWGLSEEFLTTEGKRQGMLLIQSSLNGLGPGQGIYLAKQNRRKRIKHPGAFHTARTRRIPGCGAKCGGTSPSSSRRRASAHSDSANRDGGISRGSCFRLQAVTGNRRGFLSNLHGRRSSSIRTRAQQRIA